MTDGSIPPPGRTGRRADRSGTPPQSGRRAEQAPRRRIDTVVALALALPVLVAIGLLVARGGDTTPSADVPPTPARLSNATVVCPSATATDGTVSTTRVPDVDGGDLEVRVTESGHLTATDPVTVEQGAPVVLPDSTGPVTLTGTGSAAAGIVAGRDDPLSAPECRTPAYDEWFVGLGAAARNSSVLELVNPDQGPAVVDVALVGPRGPVEEEALRGIEVPGRGVEVLSLSEIAPKRVDMSAHLTVTRGRVSATVRHTFDPLGRGEVTTDFLPAQAEPTTESLLLGVPADGGDGELFLGNTTDDELRATVRVVTAEAVFSPSGVDEVVVPPQSLRKVRLSRLLPPEATAGALGLEITTTEPAVVGVRAFSGSDLALIGPSPVLEDPATAVLPVGPKRLVLAGAENAGTVQVTALDADGEPVAEEALEVNSDRATELELPEEAVAVTVESRSTVVSGSVLVTGTPRAPGLGVVRLRAAAVYAQVPAVAPAQPD